MIHAAPHVSLILTVYNRDRYLSAAIESILKQTYADFELLIWDDGSTDRSVDIARRYAESDSRIRVIAAAHQGHVLALKAAHAEINGTYVGWVDSDDLLAPTALEATKAILDANPAIGVVYTDYLVVNKAGRIKGLGRQCRIPYSVDRLLVEFMTFQFRLLRRSLYEQVGGVDPGIPYAEDYDLCLKLSEVTQFYHLREPLYYYRIHSASMSKRHQREQIRDARVAVTHALKRRGLEDEILGNSRSNHAKSAVERIRRRSFPHFST
jgi:glycosyltransferase involved in cell wall biosynthesis